MDWQDVKTWFVLVVDDEKTNREVIIDSLAFFGARVIAAEGGTEGIIEASGQHPNLILLDLAMPHMDGWGMLTQLRANPATRDIPVVAVSAHAMNGDKERVLAAGFDGYLAKPVNIPTLIRDIRATYNEAHRVALREYVKVADSGR